jgi:hypothetical protein
LPPPPPREEKLQLFDMFDNTNNYSKRL